MTSRVVIFDSRLSTNPQGLVLAKTVVPKAAGDVTVNSNALKKTEAVIAEVAAAARGLKSPVDLTIMCHGKSQKLIGPDGAVVRIVGGTGLDIGTPGLMHSNISLVRSWKGLFSKIILLACAVGYHESKASPMKTKFDGTVFCGQLAIHSGATVIASEALQEYEVTPSTFKSILTRDEGEVDFGAWEGIVKSYNPKTGVGSLYNP